MAARISDLLEQADTQIDGMVAKGLEDVKKELAEERTLAAEYRKAYLDASANVDCEWQRGVPTDPA